MVTKVGDGERESQPEERAKSRREIALEEIDRLAQQIARSWTSPRSAVELIEDGRR
jgi:hypothetical protein